MSFKHRNRHQSAPMPYATRYALFLLLVAVVVAIGGYFLIK